MKHFMIILGWSVPVVSLITMITVAVLTIEIAISVARYGIYDGSRNKCLAHMTHVDDISRCNQEPFE